MRYAEASMKNGFGLMHLHKFLSVPFLQLQVSHTHQKLYAQAPYKCMYIVHIQQETLLQQLQVNREQTLAAHEELDSAHRTEDQNYDL